MVTVTPLSPPGMGVRPAPTSRTARGAFSTTLSGKELSAANRHNLTPNISQSGDLQREERKRFPKMYCSIDQQFLFVIGSLHTQRPNGISIPGQQCTS